MDRLRVQLVSVFSFKVAPRSRSSFSRSTGPCQLIQRSASAVTCRCSATAMVALFLTSASLDKVADNDSTEQTEDSWRTAFVILLSITLVLALILIGIVMFCLCKRVRSRPKEEEDRVYHFGSSTLPPSPTFYHQDLSYRRNRHDLVSKSLASFGSILFSVFLFQHLPLQTISRPQTAPYARTSGPNSWLHYLTASSRQVLTPERPLLDFPSPASNIVPVDDHRSGIYHDYQEIQPPARNEMMIRGYQDPHIRRLANL